MNITHYQNMLATEGYGDITQQVIQQTHASWIILTGSHAIKIKKPVNYGFLDFSTLEKRKIACENEIRLNHKNAKTLYIGVMPIYEKAGQPTLTKTDTVIEYAVHMHRFDEKNVLSEIIKRRPLSHDELDHLADAIVQAHKQADVVKTGTLGDPDTMQGFVLDNFAACESLSGGHAHLSKLARWAKHTYKMIKPIMQKRKAQGFVKECHGDLHLGNIVLLNGKPTLFDAIEFNVDFRFTDVIADIGFIMMDLMQRNLAGMASRLLNRYLEQTGDYEGLVLLPYCIAYRAMVRAKVALLTQLNLADPFLKNEEQQKYLRYLAFAHQLIQEAKPTLMIMHGVSGSGKTTLSQALLQHHLAIRIRADVERKRLHHAYPTLPLYEDKMNALTETKLYDLAAVLLPLHFNVIVDATFIKHASRERFYQLAKMTHSRFIILDCQLSDAILIERIQKREQLGRDASDATVEVMKKQQLHAEPLDQSERAFTLSFNLAKKITLDEAILKINL